MVRHDHYCLDHSVDAFENFVSYSKIFVRAGDNNVVLRDSIDHALTLLIVLSSNNRKIFAWLIKIQHLGWFLFGRSSQAQAQSQFLQQGTGLQNNKEK